VTNPAPLLLYFYVPYGDDQEKEKLYRSMWMTFWEQAIDKAEERSIYTFGHDTPSKIIEEELYKVLVSFQRNIYIIIDAIDQFSVQSHDSLLRSLSSLAIRLKRDTSSFHLRVAISSRDSNGIDQMRSHEVFTIEVTTENNQKDIDTYLEKNLDSVLFRKKPHLRNQVIEQLSKMADGMLASCHDIFLLYPLLMLRL
jgi:archaeosine-15-forming tRNA-guanine transglycosylase